MTPDQLSRHIPPEGEEAAAKALAGYWGVIYDWLPDNAKNVWRKKSRAALTQEESDDKS